MDKLGAGSFATVYKVKNKINGVIFAAKIYYKSVFEECSHQEKFSQMIFSELSLLKQF